MANHTINLGAHDWICCNGKYYRIEKTLPLEEGASIDKLEEGGFITAQHRTAYEDWLRSQSFVAICGIGAHE